MDGPKERSIGAQMNIASQLLKRRIQARIGQFQYNITIEQLGVIEVLKFNGDMNMSEIAKAQVKENAAITRMVDILEREGYVSRRKVDGDRRAVSIHITKKGEEAFDTLIPLVIEEVRDATSCITKEEHDEAMRIMKKIIVYNQEV